MYIKVEDKWYESEATTVPNNKRCKFTWDFIVQTYNTIQAIRLDMIAIDKNMHKAQVIDCAIPNNCRVDSK